MKTTIDIGNSTPQMAVKDFSNIMRRNAFTVGHSTVRRVDGGFEVITKHVMNVGNLLEIEKRWGLTIYLIEPRPDSNVQYMGCIRGIATLHEARNMNAEVYLLKNIKHKPCIVCGKRRCHMRREDGQDVICPRCALVWNVGKRRDGNV